jgi:hypothetical protein
MVMVAGAESLLLGIWKSLMGTGSSPFHPGNLSVSSIYLSVLRQRETVQSLLEHWFLEAKTKNWQPS